MQSAIIGRILPPPPPSAPRPLVRGIAWLWCAASAIPVLVLAHANSASLGLAIIATLFLLAKFAGAWCLMVRWRDRDVKRRAKRSEVEFIFCADAADVETLLPEHFGSATAANGLLALGNLHTLGTDLTQGTVAFSRDRDEPWPHNAPQVHGAAAFWNCPPLAGQARLWYLYDGTRWHVKDGRHALDSWDARRSPWREL